MSQTNENRIDFVPTPVARDFMLSDAYVRVLAGPIGAGKSVACVHELLRWATEQRPNRDGVRKTRFLICRNTADQLRSTTLKTIFAWLPPSLAGSWVVTEKTFYLRYGLPDGTTVESEWMAIALDTPDDVRKALSLEATGLWGNEARELHPVVVDGLLSRVDRYPDPREGGPTRPGAIFDTNMPQEGSWWFEKMVAPPENWKVFIQPPAILTQAEFAQKYGKGEFYRRAGRHEVYGYVSSEGQVSLFAKTPDSGKDKEQPLVARGADNVTYVVDPAAENFGQLNSTYYVNTLQGKPSEFLNVYLRCKFGTSREGRPVFESFRRDFHVAKNQLAPIVDATRPLLIGMDFGLTPAAVIGQIDPRGRLLVLDELVSDGMGIFRFSRELLKPLLASRFPRFPVRIIGDPAGAQRASTDERSVYDILKAEGFVVEPAPTNRISARLAAVERLLSYVVDGAAAMLVDPRCKNLIYALSGGYRYRMRKDGEFDDAPEKNSSSHIADAYQYLCCHVSGIALREAGGLRSGKPVVVRKLSMAPWV